MGIKDEMREMITLEIMRANVDIDDLEAEIERAQADLTEVYEKLDYWESSLEELEEEGA